MIFKHYKMLGCYRLPPLKGISSPRFGEARKANAWDDSDNSIGFEKCKCLTWKPESWQGMIDWGGQKDSLGSPGLCNRD